MVNVREFTSTDIVQLDIGSLVPFNTGACTFAAIIRNANAGNFKPIIAFDGGNERRSFWKNSSNNMMMDSGGFSADFNLSLDIASSWLLVLWTKTNGTTAPVGHRRSFFGGTWNHEVSASTLGNDATTLTTISIGRSNGSNVSWQGRMALLAAWNSVIGNDAFIENLNLHVGLQNWIDANPDGLWPLNQGAVTDNVVDITGKGANQIDRVGTSVVDDTDLNFDFSTEQNLVSDGMSYAVWASRFLRST